ncbi:MAG: decaprenyl-phosphate phosphoribosyltransferase [Anaerolineae bacterium]|nr:MAG: decaprenyl-phosphate phosphoribosyltransferase [Anaerolineae bacterium]
MREMLKALIRAMRPRQWTKNVFIFAALIFDEQLTQRDPLLRTVAGFVLLCLISSAVYVLNDIADVEADRQHPTKRNRPIAAGLLSIPVAVVFAIALAVFSMAASFALEPGFGWIVTLYFVLNLLYSFWLKHAPIIDVLIIAAGFVLRVAAGVALIEVARFSPWLYVVTTFLALIIGFGKRRAEIILLAEGANAHRKVLDGYTIGLLDQLIVIVSASTIMAYSLYTFSAQNLPSNNLMMLTIPFVIYGVFRYIYLIHIENAGGAPEELILTDRPLLATLVLWGLLAALILYL